MNTDLNIGFLVILVIAMLLLIVGVVLYLILIRRSNPKLFYSSVIISWVLISMFPVVLLFSVFQNSSLAGEFTGTSFGTITVGGAFGAFFVIWFVGTYNTLNAIKADNNEETIKTLNEKIADLEKQFKELNAKPKDTRVISESSRIEYKIKNHDHKILGVITGDIQQVRGIDLWVNSENTNLQMARFYDPSISGLIRYLGAEKDTEGNVTRDIIADALQKTIDDKFPSVKTGKALFTTSGKLQQTHGVQGIIHVTTVFGEIGQGYTPIKNMGVCVQQALIEADRFASVNKKKNVSIVFPLLGTGTAKGDLGLVILGLFHAVLTYFETNRVSKIDKVYFTTWKEYEKEACLKILDEMQVLVPRRPS